MSVIDTPHLGAGCENPAELERILNGLLADVLGVAEVDPRSNVFTELGADSMTMTRFCARVRKHGGLPPVSMRDVYRHPTLAALAAALTPVPPAPSAPSAPSTVAGPTPPDVLGGSWAESDRPGTAVATSAPGAGPVAAPGRPEPEVPAKGTPHYVLCGVLQSLVMFALVVEGAFLTAQAYEWIYLARGLLGAGSHWVLDHLPAAPAPGTQGGPLAALVAAEVPVRNWLVGRLFGDGALDVYLRAVIYAVVGFVLLSALPIVLKWLLVGRCRRRRIRIWSLGYVRFWTVKTLIRTSPLMLFVGTPIYVAYLRTLGAHIGRGAAIFTRIAPAAPDLLTIGENTVVRKDAAISCYRAVGGVIETGPVTLASNVLVSEATVLDIDTSMGHWSQLGHASSLHSGQFVPSRESWHGSPAQPSDVDYRKIENRRCGSIRRLVYSLTQLAGALFLLGPMMLSALTELALAFPRLGALVDPVQPSLGNPEFWVEVLGTSYFLFFGALFVGLLLLMVLPRLLKVVLRPGRVYRLYGLRYSVFRMVSRMTNMHFFGRLFGDSSFVVGYLRGVGFGLRPVVQTGSNFGSEFKQDLSYLTAVGSGTMIADGLSVVNADYTHNSFRVAPVSIGERNFLGNKITYPAEGRTGANCLLATKVHVPIDGKVREDVGLLGSPSFEIPRTVERDARIGAAAEDLRRRRLPAKNDHNVVTMAIFLFAWWLNFAVTLVLMAVAFDRYPYWGFWAFVASGSVALVFRIWYWVLVDKCVRRLVAYRPAGCSIYDKAFWRHERFWKVCDDRFLLLLNGTPMKNLVWRRLGVRMGRRVFDDGAFFPERTLVTLGDEVTLNSDTHIQCHSQEDGAFKSDHTVVGAHCTLGVGAFVHYGVSLGDHVELLPDSFVMKGEEVPAGARWGGNPARQM